MQSTNCSFIQQILRYSHISGMLYVVYVSPKIQVVKLEGFELIIHYHLQPHFTHCKVYTSYQLILICCFSLLMQIQYIQQFLSLLSPYNLHTQTITNNNPTQTRPLSIRRFPHSQTELRSIGFVSTFPTFPVTSGRSNLPDPGDRQRHRLVTIAILTNDCRCRRKL